jgi:hypothetical protein
VRGYGETAVVEVAKAVMQNGIACEQGIHYAHTLDRGQLAEPKPSELVKFPSPFLQGLVLPQQFMRWQTMYQSLAGAPKQLHFPLRRVLEEVSWFCERQPTVKHISLIDKNVGAENPERTNRILYEFIERGFVGKISMNLPLSVEDSVVKALHELRDAGIHLRLNFYLKSIHVDENGPSSSMLEAFGRTLEQLTAADIDHKVTIYFGLQTQTFSSFQETIKWIDATSAKCRLVILPIFLTRGRCTINHAHIRNETHALAPQPLLNHPKYTQVGITCSIIYSYSTMSGVQCLLYRHE